MLRKLWFVPVLVALCLASIAGAQGRSEGTSFYYTGTIGNLPVQMTLIYPAGIVPLYGAYYYESAGQTLSLRGTLQPRNGIRLKDYTPNGAQAGTFTGTVSANRRTLSGTWTSVDGARTLPFALDAVAQYVPVPARQGRLEMTGSYPSFLAPSPVLRQLSGVLRWQVRNAQQRFIRQTDPNYPGPGALTQDYDIAIAYYSQALVSLLTTEFSFSGGAHPNTVYTAQNYQLTDAGFTLISQAQLFRPLSDYQSVLYNLAVADLRRQKTARGVEATLPSEFGFEDFNVYTITPAGITYVFSPYVAGAYVEGAYFVTIPYPAIRDIINPTGPLQRFLPATTP